MDIEMTFEKGLQPHMSNFVEWMHFKVGFWHGLIEASEMSCQVSSVLTRYLVLCMYFKSFTNFEITVACGLVSLVFEDFKFKISEG